MIFAASLLFFSQASAGAPESAAPPWKAPTSVDVALIKDEEVLPPTGVSSKGLYQLGFLSRIPALISVLQLVDEGKVQLDQPLNTYLKGFQVKSPFITAEHLLTVRDVLTERSGFDLYKFPGSAPGSPIPDVVQMLKRQSMSFAPGTKVASSAVNMELVQLLLESVEGKSYASIIQQRVIQPLHLANTFLDGALPASASLRIVKGEKARMGYPELAAQGLWSNAHDVALMISSLMKSANSESKLLKPETATLLFTPVERGVTYGLKRQSLREGFKVFLGGQSSGYSAKACFIPEDGNGVVVLTNADMGWPTIDARIASGFKTVTGMKVGDTAASFEPYHVSGEYAGQTICPICEYPLLPVAFFWVQHDTDANILAAARIFQASINEAGPAKQKALIVLSNFDGNFEANKARATHLASLSKTPNVSFVVVKSPTASTLPSYRIPRDSKNMVYLVNSRIVKTAWRDVVLNSQESNRLAQALKKARS